MVKRGVVFGFFCAALLPASSLMALPRENARPGEIVFKGVSRLSHGATAREPGNGLQSPISFGASPPIQMEFGRSLPPEINALNPIEFKPAMGLGAEKSGFQARRGSVLYSSPALQGDRGKSEAFQSVSSNHVWEDGAGDSLFDGRNALPVSGQGEGPVSPDPSVSIFHGASASTVSIIKLARSGHPPGGARDGPRGLEGEERYSLQSCGSGFSIGDGYILTNEHVVRGGDLILAELSNGIEHPAMVLGQDYGQDVAVLRIAGGAGILPALSIGDSSGVRPGKSAFAIGNPFGLGLSITKGIISAVGRTVQSKSGVSYGMLQTDAAVNPGNSGGPLLDEKGWVIGMNSSIQSLVGENNGIAYAIPMERVLKVARSLIDGILAPSPELGFVAVSKREKYALPGGVRIQGVVVKKVAPGSPAEQAGLQGLEESYSLDESGQASPRHSIGDVIIGVGGRRIYREEDLIRILESSPPGQTIELEIWNHPSKTKRVVVLSHGV